MSTGSWHGGSYSPRSWYGALRKRQCHERQPCVRLTGDEVADLTDPRIRLRNVQPSGEYHINCLVVTPEAIDLAVKLTQRASDEARRLRNGDPAGWRLLPSSDYDHSAT